MERVQIGSSKIINDQTFKLLAKKWGQYTCHWQNLEGTKISLPVGKRIFSSTARKWVVRDYFKRQSGATYQNDDCFNPATLPTVVWGL